MQANQQIVFLDSQVTDYLGLIDGVVPGIVTVILKSDRDGIEQITEVLEKRTYSIVHLVSHGSPGCLYLGNNKLYLDNLKDYKSDLKSWFTSSLLLYGCNVASGDAGTEFITQLNRQMYIAITT